ncbi:DNA polymerase alpha catalytic subunit-like [Clavelina lepadiformis]|uniref:DNA polymerase n=1 Tax=Clavelina lepadiformis TaxID=159417 RepID=A0ABP0G4E1_CLALP
MDPTTDDAGQSPSQGLATGRSRRERKDKHGRLAALKRLRESKSTGHRIRYEVEEVKNVYDEVAEDEYCEKVQKRLDDDWIVDDGLGEYVEDGREIFDEEAEIPGKQTSKSKSSKKGATSSQKKIRVVKSSDIKNMLLQSSGKKKAEKSVDLSKDNLLGDILQEINSTDVLSVPRPAVLLKKKKKLPVTPDISSFSAGTGTNAEVMSPPSSLPRGRMKPRKIVAPAPLTFDEPDDMTPVEVVTPPAKRSKVDEGVERFSENLDKTIRPTDSATAAQNDQSMEIEFEATDFDEVEFDDVSRKPAKAQQVKPVPKTAESFLHQLTSLGWETVKNEGSEVTTADLKIDSSSLPLHKTDDGEQVFRFYWIDAYEDQYKQPGVVFMFGKVFVEAAKKHVSCCLTVKNIDRKIYLLPREKNRKTGEEVSPQDVYQEFDSEVADKHKIMKFKTKMLEKKYVFGQKDIPHETQYLEISYPAEYGQLSQDLSGDTFRCAFGTHQSPLESLLLQRKIKGPCWLDITKPQLNTAPSSWCKLELTAVSPSDVSVVENLPAPPLVVLSLNMQTLPNLKTHQNEIIGVAGLVHNSFPIDKSAPKPAFQQSFFALTKPSDCIFPFDLRNANKKKGFNLEIFGTERSLLCFFLGKLLKVDPDVIIGHDILNFDLDVLLHRLSSCKVPHWSRIGRLRKLNMPKLLGGGRFSDRSVTCGRIVCDVKVFSKELIRCKSYDLTALTDHVLRKSRKELPTDQIKNMFTTSDSLLWMIEHTFLDSSFILDITCELNALPLALQITNIAGNVLSRTLMGGRSERNEFLLLHAFHEKGYIPPDKIFKKKELTGHAGEAGQTGRTRKKAAYAGGLVLEPKRGFYDKYILLLDFNSLYPSIIQEYNICFTTLQRHPPSGGDVDVESYIPEVPESGLEMGVLPTEIRKLVQRRRQVKNLMKEAGISKDQYTQYDIRQKALKLTANSMYGCLGFSNSRFYAKPLAALVTRQGREILLHTKELAQKMGLEVIYGDTDSIMINTNSTDMEHAFKLGNQVKSEVNKLYRLLEIDIDGVYKSLLLLKKKKYAALSVQRLPDGGYTTSQELKGLDIVRRDWCDLAKLAGNFAVNQILSDQSREDIVEKIHENLQEIERKVKSNEYPLETFLIRKELTKDPHLYPGKDNLPHVKVALRINKSMAKRLKSGDVVSYIVCQDGSTAPATHRAYTIDEIKSSDNLLVDSEYYLSQQVHPVVTRLCDPIDGTDASLIAQCLGLDPSGFKRSQTQDGDEEARSISLQATEEEKYCSCKKLVFVCPESKKELILDQGVFAETDPQWMCTLSTPCGENNSKTLVDFFVSLQNQLTIAIREDVHKYYQGWVSCDDPACGHRSRALPFLHDKQGAICNVCFKGVLKSEVTYKSLYHQLCYYKLQFDVEYALKKYKQDSNNSKGSLKVKEHRTRYKSLSEIVDFYLNQSGYNEVSMNRLFGWMKLNSS